MKEVTHSKKKEEVFLFFSLESEPDGTFLSSCHSVFVIIMHCENTSGEIKWVKYLIWEELYGTSVQQNLRTLAFSISLVPDKKCVKILQMEIHQDFTYC